MSIPLAILWHQHQPYYKDLASGEMAMPWVRLHGIKDYYGMARLIQEHPGLRCAINLVPSLVTQLLDYVERGATDPYLRHTRLPADALKSDEAQFVLDHFFMAQWDRMIRVWPRYRELLELRRFGRRPAWRALDDFAARDLRDLQVWFTLAWFHPVCFEEFEALRALREKGRDFSEADKANLLRVHDEVLARVVPLHRALAASGQVELTTTPFYHPILPLLCDMQSARAAMPNTALPAGHFKNVEDAEAHVAKAVHFHRRIFGCDPEGLWPAEGSVSPEILPLLARHGIRWLATDEEILSASLKTGLRGGYGRLERPELLYRPWRLDAGDGKELAVLFRDHELSDLVGFQYQSWDGETAAADFLARVRAGGARAPAGGETLVSVILDGENCWEHYPEQGLKFLRTLYARLQDGRAGVAPVRPRDFLAGHPPTRRLETLFPGSWINHDFYIWIGHHEDRKAWEYVFRVREDLVRATEARGRKAADFAFGMDGAHSGDDLALAKAWEELFVAEGSDWYWWYGDDRTSGDDEGFDRLFRVHLKNVYRFLGQPSPYFLDDPVMAAGKGVRFTQPSAALQVTLDGRVTNYFEWLGAGVYRADKEGGVMAAAGAPLVFQVLYGYEPGHLCVRLDLFDDPRTPENEARPGGAVSGVALRFHEPAGLALDADLGPPLALRHEGPWKAGLDGTQIVWDEVIEVRVPLVSLDVKAGQALSFFVEARRPDGSVERYPRAFPIQLTLPQEGAEDQEWTA